MVLAKRLASPRFWSRCMNGLRALNLTFPTQQPWIPPTLRAATRFEIPALQRTVRLATRWIRVHYEMLWALHPQRKQLQGHGVKRSYRLLRWVQTVRSKSTSRSIQILRPWSLCLVTMGRSRGKPQYRQCELRRRRLHRLCRYRTSPAHLRQRCQVTHRLLPPRADRFLNLRLHLCRSRSFLHLMYISPPRTVPIGSKAQLAGKPFI
jgi:hypothetical protein